MNMTLLKSKIHQARVTGIDMSYEGSIVVDAELMEEVNLVPFERVLVANVSTGARFETYVIAGEPGSGIIALNGATARLGQIGDQVIIFAFAMVPESQAKAFSPKIVQLDDQNRIVRRSYVK